VPDNDNACVIVRCKLGAVELTNVPLGTKCGINKACDGGGECVMPPSISAGGGHTCGLTSAGAVLCWGNNSHGQLGDKTIVPRSVPTPVEGLGAGIIQISAGLQHTCAITSVGGVVCWGYNGSGQLGDGSLASKLSPNPVASMESGAKFVSAGGDHTCVLTTIGGVKCWGNNAQGQLGDGTVTTSSVVKSVVGLESGVVAISSGQNHSCAVTALGSAKCWGSNNDGQLGDGTKEDRLFPTPVWGLVVDTVAVYAGSLHTCAITMGGKPWCWGSNGNGAIGDGSTYDHTIPVAVVGLASDVVQMAVSKGEVRVHTCAVDRSGRATCWGFGGDGELGDGGTGNQLVPTEVVGLSVGAIGVSAGSYHTCAVVDDGTAMCWGRNQWGEIGDGLSAQKNVPELVVGFP